MRVVWLEIANNERFAQLRYIVRDNPAAAARVAAEIRTQIRQLGEHPMMGRAGREPGTRERVISRTPFIAVYHIRLDRGEILRILHTSQHWPPHT